LSVAIEIKIPHSPRNDNPEELTAND
jgi:hypothetical protein